jgi:hypothetical protein
MIFCASKRLSEVGIIAVLFGTEKSKLKVHKMCVYLVIIEHLLHIWCDKICFIFLIELFETQQQNFQCF